MVPDPASKIVFSVIASPEGAWQSRVEVFTPTPKFGVGVCDYKEVIISIWYFLMTSRSSSTICFSVSVSSANCDGA